VDGQSRVEHVCAVLQGGGVVEYHEAELEVLEAGVTVDTKHVAVGFAVIVHGETHLDGASLRGLHNG